jgi:two-component system, OmpR family, response regulator
LWQLRGLVLARTVKGKSFMRVLMVEDEPRVADFVGRGLRAEGWSVDHVPSAEDALERLWEANYDVILLDVMLPGMSGDDFCRQLRVKRNPVPILILSALGSTEDRVRGLANGADDYLPKPFEFDELIARVEALHRRNTRIVSPETDRTLAVGLLDFDPASLRLRLDGEELDLLAKERDILVFLMRNVGRACGRDRLLSSVWGDEADPLPNTVDVTVNRIRRKLGAASQMITTIRNYGYRLDA